MTKKTKKEQEQDDFIGRIIAYETNELDDNGTLELFAELIKSGQCWSLQGHYGRTASAIIERGIISKEGVIDWDLFNELKEV